MHSKRRKCVRAIILTTLTVLGTASLSVSKDIKTLAQIPSVQSLEQQSQISPTLSSGTNNTSIPVVKDGITDSLIEKPPVICRIIRIRNILSWKCPVQDMGNNSVNIPKRGVNKKQNNPQIQIHNNR